MVKRTVGSLVLALAVSISLAHAAPARVQDQPPPAQSADPAKATFFSGIVTELNDNSVTVNRKGLGQDSATHTFAIDPNTRVEGKLKVKAKVTVRFVNNGDNLTAVHIIVR